MTATAETAGTELVQVAPGLIAQIQDNEPFTVADLADRLVSPDRVLPKDEPAPAAAPQVKVTDTLKAALTRLPKVFARVSPTEPRLLEQDELIKLTEEVLTIDAVTTQLGERREAIAETIRIHMDKAAEAVGGEDGLPRIAEGKAKGHYLLGRKGEPFEIAVPGYRSGWQQRFVKGSSKIDGKLLVGLLRNETITSREFNAVTRTVRVLDEDKLAVAIRKNPGRFLSILGSITRKGAPSASLYPPKQ